MLFHTQALHLSLQLSTRLPIPNNGQGHILATANQIRHGVDQDIQPFINNQGTSINNRVGLHILSSARGKARGVDTIGHQTHACRIYIPVLASVLPQLLGNHKQPVCLTGNQTFQLQPLLEALRVTKLRHAGGSAQFPQATHFILERNA